MNWNEKRLDTAGIYEFCGFESRKAKNGKPYDVIKLDGYNSSYWLPVFAVLDANISPEEAKLHKGQVEVNIIDDKYSLKFLRA